MQAQWRRLAFYTAIVLTVFAIMFPPFTINAVGGGFDEYGFIFSGPASVSQYMNQMSALGGVQGRQIAGGFIHYNLDMIRLVFEIVAILSIHFALRRTVLKLDFA